MKVMVEVEVEEIAEQILKQLAESGDVIQVVRCKDCKHTCREDDHEIWCTGRGSPCQLVAPDGFCDKGRRSE